MTSAILDDNYLRYVGYEEDNRCIKKYFSPDTVKIISNKVTELLEGVMTNGASIKVTDRVIGHMLSQIYYAYRPPTGDVYGRYNVPTGEPDDMVQALIDQTIEALVSQIRTTLEMEQNNAKLSVWTTVLGEGLNEHGLRSYAPLKIRKKNTNHRGEVSFMNY
jgi:hypothetical protein